MEIQQQSRNHPSPSSLLAQSPNFTSCSSQKLADIAARVVNELHLSDHDDPFDDDDFYSCLHPNDAVPHQKDDDDDDDDDESEFEFAILCGDDNSSPISADDIFHNGQIKPVYPIFDTTLVYQNDAIHAEEPSPPSTRLPLRKLMTEEREISGGGASCSSSEADDLEGVPQETYCVWVPKEKKSKNDDVSMRKKSKSTGSNSKRWRIRDLVHRSNSDGKDTFVFLTPSHSRENHQQNGGDPKRRQQVTAAKRKTYLPYRQDLVGLFANGNGISRTVRPF